MSHKLQNPKDEMILSTMESLVPEDHLVRKLDKYIKFGFIRDITSKYYKDKGRPGYDPVILFKLAFVKSVFGIPSIRQTCEELKVNIAYRWFLGIPFSENIPHHSTYSKNYTERFYHTDVYQQVFSYILKQVIEKDLLDLTHINIDSTHIKASANKKKFIEEVIKKEKSIYEDEMLALINEERAKDDDKPLPPSPPTGTKKTKVSTTDKDAGWLNKGEKEKNFSFNAHTACDNHGFIINTVLKPSNIHDSKVFPEVYDPLVDAYKAQIESIAVDAGYHSGPLIKRITDNHHLPLLPKKKTMSRQTYDLFRKLTYDQVNNTYTHIDGSIYHYVNVNRQGYRTYQTKDKQSLRITIYKPYFDYTREIRLSQYGTKYYSRRKETIERCFADFKERHFGRYTHYRGLKKVSDHTLLIFASMNMKKMVNLLAKFNMDISFIASLFNKISQFIRNLLNKKHSFLPSLLT